MWRVIVVVREYLDRAVGEKAHNVAFVGHFMYQLPDRCR